MNKKLIKFLSLLLILSILPLNSFAAFNSIKYSGSQTVTVVMGARNEYLRLSNGNTLGGEGWTYTTDNGISGPGYCVDHGLAAVPQTKSLSITGQYTNSPKTAGAFANGYPQRTLAEFHELNPGIPELTGLTIDEYAYATQVAVWATLGQVAVEGTAFTAGRDNLPSSQSGTQRQRVFKAIETILWHANTWDKNLETHMGIRIGEDDNRETIDVRNSRGLEGAAERTLYGIQKETINGTEYYTREYIVASSTSTYKHDYFIEIWAENAPSGTIFTSMNNIPLETVVWDGQTLSKVPTPVFETPGVGNGREWKGYFKICLPVQNTEPNGSIRIGATTTVDQYNIYLVTNTAHNEQSYIIGDPAYSEWKAFGALNWYTQESVYGTLTVKKVDNMGRPLQGAMFELIGNDGTSFTGTSDINGDIRWDRLTPDINYELKEVKAPDGYLLAASQNITVPKGETRNVTVKNESTRTAIIKKVDTQNGSSLTGAKFRFEQIDGSYKTDRVTGHDGIIDFSDIPHGSFKVFEVEAPNGYKKDETIQTINWDGKNDIILHFTNTREFSLRLIKVDEETQVSLSGATFNVYRDGKLITTVTTDDSGYASVSGISEGYFEIVESVAPKGYILDTTRHGIYIDPYNPETDNDPVLMISNRKKPTLKIIKYDSQSMTFLPNTIFEVYKDTVLIGQYTTDSRGEINITDLAEGTYTVKEIATDSSHIVKCSPQQIELKAGQSAQLVFLNDLKPGMRIVKLDSETLKPLAGVIFKISQVGGTYSQEFTTDKDGEIDLSNLSAGAYSVLEVAAPNGYVVDNSSRIIQLNPNETASFIFTNTKKPSIKIVKVSGDGSKPLEGATFRIASIADGTRYFDRTTDRNGIIELEDVEIGIFSVQELAAPTGYLLNDTEYHVETFAGQMSQLVVKNHIKPSLKIIKLDSQTNERLSNTTFAIYRDTTLIGIHTTDENGEVILTHLSTGTYTVMEVATDFNHIVNTEPQMIEIREDSEDTAVLVFINQRKPYIEILKLDSQTMLPLQGATFLITQIGGSFAREYITDENGKILLDPLEKGTYEIKEISAPNGYLIDEGTRVIELNGDEYAPLVFTNSKMPTLTVDKIDPYTHKGLKGAKFEVYRAVNGSLLGEIVKVGDYISDENGQFKLENLELGWYRIKEIQAPNGYILQNDVIDIFLEAGKNAVITFENLKKPSLFIKKIDSITKDVLKNAKFEVIKSGIDNGSIEKLGEYVTNADGIIELKELSDGWYKVREIEAPNGYILKTETQDIYIEAGKDYSVVFENQPKSAIVIKKVDGDTGELLSGAHFRVRLASGAESGTSGKVIGNYITSNNGTIVITELDIGAYIIEETKAPNGYLITENAPQTVWLAEGDTAVVETTFFNYKRGGLLIKKMDAVTRQPLAEAIFKVTDSKGAVVGTSNGEFRTDKKGTIYIPDIFGSFVVQEIKSPNGYILDNTAQTIEIGHNKIYSLEFFNQPLNDFIIVKMDGDTKAPLKDAVIKITTVDDTFIGEYRTDESGTISLKDLQVGTYKVQEIAAPNGYLLDDTVKLVHLHQNEPVKVEIYNYKQAALIITKTDIVSGKPLSGAKFEIRGINGQIHGTYTTNAHGQIIVSQLNPDWYIVTETVAPSGYILDSTPQSISIIKGRISNLEFVNQPLNSIVIQKLDGDTRQPLSNAVIKVTTVDDKYIGEYRTDSTGTITVRGLETGTYKVQELAAPSGYLLDDTVKLVHLRQGISEKVEIFNYKKGTLIICKRDSVTNKGLYGAQFEVREVDGRFLGTYTSKSNGEVIIPNIENGWYTVKEVKAPEGYALNLTCIKNIEVKSGEPARLDFENNKYPTLTIRKTDSVTKKPLKDVKFSVVRDDGKLYGEYFTNQYGEIYIENKLEKGTFEITELETLNGYKLDTNSKRITLNWGDDKRIEWENNPYGSLEIYKYDVDDNKPIEGVEFEIVDSNNNSIGRYTTDGNGRIYLPQQFEAGNYSFRETKAPQEYIPITGLRSFTINWGKTTTTYVSNIPIEGQIEIYKKSAENNKITGTLKDAPLQGVEFTIFDINGIAVEKLVTDGSGRAISGKLRYGKYIVKETKEADYYVKDTDAHEIFVDIDGKVYTLELFNTPTRLETNVEKSGYAQAMEGDTIKYELYNIQNRSNVPLDNFYLHDSIPTDSTRITRIFTGTYNQNLNYKIMYKTNLMGGYKVLRDNLFTDKIYEIDCTHYALGLQENEYVTDIIFEFGTVKVGFRETERPFIYAQIINGLPHSYKFTNTVTVGGRYKDEITKSSDTFTTSIYNVPENKGKLPKTGY